jgi:MFS family permease
VFVATVAAQIQTVVVAWQIYGLTRDALSLGLIGLTEAVPFIGVALFAGHVADRTDRRIIALASLGVLCTCAVLLLAITLRLSGSGGRVWPIYAVIALSGLGRSFLTPARNALVTELVPRELFSNAVAWRSSAWQLAAVTGPAFGGLLYGFGSARLAYSVVATLMLVAFTCMWQVRREVRPAPVHHETSIRESLATGIRFLFSQPIVLGALTLDMFSVLFGGATALLPVFAAEILHVGPQGLGILQSAPASGAVVMSLVLAHRPPFRSAGRSLFMAVALFGVFTIGFALSRSFPWSVACLAAAGMADMVSVVIRSTLLQVFTPHHLMGRVSSVNSIFIGSSNEIGAFESGVAARLLGTVPSVLFGATMTLLVVAVTAWRVPDLRRLREIK